MMTAAAGPIRTAADLRGRRALVLGLARSGIAAARFLADAGADVTAYDRRTATELGDPTSALGGRSVRLVLGVEPAVAARLVAGADLVVTSPSISPRFPTTDAWLRDALRAAERSGAVLMSEVDLFLRLTQARIAAVTGTKGKTTTASLVDAMLTASEVPHLLGGNIGRPLVEHSLELTVEEWAVLELSELQLPTISRGADVAIYTNILADHLDRHGSVKAYRAVKGRLAELAAPSAVVVLNRDDEGCRALAAATHGTVVWYGLQDGSGSALGDGALSGDSLAATVANGHVTLRGEPILPVAEVPLPGRHMLADVLAAALGASLAGATPGPIGQAIRGFRAIPHRLEPVAERQGVRYVNDSQATIPPAAIAALEAFAPSPVVLIAGGQGKGLGYEGFAEAIVRGCRAAVLIGETAAEMERLVAGRVPVRRAETMREAVEAAAAAATPGDVVLLSPAAASFDMFTDYAARGEAFRSALAALSGAPHAMPESGPE